jgi:hypothetical protein
MEGIRADLSLAMGLERCWQRCANDRTILDRMRNTPEGVAFDIMRTGVHMAGVLALTRMYDRDNRTSSIEGVLKILRDEDVRSALKSRSSLRRAKLDDWIAGAEKIINAKATSGYLKTLRALRDQHIAHRDFDPKPHGAKYGHTPKLLSRTMRAVEFLELALTGTSSQFEAERRYYGRAADRFWRHAAKPSR